MLEFYATLHPGGMSPPRHSVFQGPNCSPNFTSVFIFQFQELGIKHPLHRKKLVLAVKAINTKQEEKSALLDHIWVTRKDRRICIMFLAAPQSGHVNGCLGDSCPLGKGRWITEPYGECNWDSRMIAHCPSLCFVLTFTLPRARESSRTSFCRLA